MIVTTVNQNNDVNCKREKWQSDAELIGILDIVDLHKTEV